MPDYFFDTSVLAAFAKREDARSISLLEAVVAGTVTAAVSAITVAELCSSPEMEDPSVRDEELALLTLLDVVPVDGRLAQRGGEIRRQHALGLADALIAASAESAGGQFMSKDSHFARLLRAGLLAGEIYL